MSKAAELAKMGEVLTNNQIGGRRNIIINGAMQVAQRSTSLTVGDSTEYKTLDRYPININGTTAGRATMSQSTDAPNGFGYSMKYDVTTADTSIGASESFGFGQRIEGQDVQQFKKGTSDAERGVLSFYVKGTAKTYIVEIRDDNSRFFSKTFSVTSSWNRVTIDIPADTTGTIDNDTTTGMNVLFWLHAGSDYTSGTLSTSWATSVNANRMVGCESIFSSTDNELFITGIQLEVGEQATPFEHRSFGEELLLCRRYTIQDALYYAGCFGGGGTIPISSTTFPVKMRAAPTITYISGGTASDGVADYSVTGLNSTQNVADSGARILFTQTGTGAGGRGLDLKAATLRYDAELQEKL